MARRELPASPDPKDPRVSLHELVQEMRTIALVAGQCSVEGPQDTKAAMAAAEAERAARWADAIERLGWQPIETAPDVPLAGSPVDVLLHGASIGVRSGRACRYPDGYVFAGVANINGNLAHDGYVTHWMPLPAAPIAKDGRAPGAPTPDVGGSAGKPDPS
jgi:hypothetical protein